MGGQGGLETGGAQPPSNLNDAVIFKTITNSILDNLKLCNVIDLCMCNICNIMSSLKPLQFFNAVYKPLNQF